MTKDDLENLLIESEGDRIDWKVKPPEGLELPAKDQTHQEARGEMIKDIEALANADSLSPRYLIWGVADNVKPRRVKPFTSNSKKFDDAKFQDWVKNAIEPSLKFNYEEVDWEPESVVGVFKIYPEPGQVYVAKDNVGGVLHKGQVWYRKSSQNNVATYKQLKKFFTDTGIQLTVGFMNKSGNFGTPLQIRRRSNDDIDLQSLYYQKRYKVIEKFEELQKATLTQKARMAARQPSSEEILASRLDSETRNAMIKIGRGVNRSLGIWGEVKLSQSKATFVTNFLDKIGITYTSDNFEFNHLSYGMNLSSFLGGQQIIGDEKEKERYYLFWEVFRAVQEAEHDIKEDIRVLAYFAVRFGMQNTGRKSAHKLEIEISPVGDSRLHFYNTVPSKKPMPLPERDIQATLALMDPLATYEAKPIPKFQKEVSHLPPGGIKEIGQVAIRPSKEGNFQFSVVVKGQDIPEPLEFLLEIVVEAP
jgi:hypothetical protein